MDITTDSSLQNPFPVASFRGKALGNLSILSNIAADSTCCIPFYRSGKGAAINFAPQTNLPNSSCFTIFEAITPLAAKSITLPLSLSWFLRVK